VIVEIKDSRVFFLRHLSANRDGSFSDLNTLYRPNSVERAPRAAALVMGDTHVDFIDPRVEQATFGRGGLVDTVDPEKLIWHDLLDGYAVNPHHFGNPFNAYAKRQSGKDNVRAEVQRAIEFVRQRTGTRQSIVVSSNHDDFLRRWIVTTDWRSDPTNAAFYLKTAAAMLSETRLDGSGTSYPSPFAYWIEQAGDQRVRALQPDEPLTILGVELSLHGDRGPNGSWTQPHTGYRRGMHAGGHKHTA
jgi:hypothetical protein